MMSSWFFRQGALHATFHDWFWKSDHDFLLVVYGNFCPNSNRLDVIRHFLFAWDFPTGSEILVFLGANDPQKVIISKNTCLKGISLITHSESVIKKCLKRPLAEIKSYYGTLSGSHGCSFRIRHGILPETPPGSKIKMTSYPACNKTSLSLKPWIPDKNLLWNATGRSWLLFQNPSWKIAWSAPWRRTDDDVMSGWQ